MGKKRTAQFGSFSLQLVLCSAAVCSMITGTLLAFFHPETTAKTSQRMLTFAERVAYQRAIEEVYWRHRIWPKERPDPKPSLDVVMTQMQLEKKVRDYLRTSQALDDYWQRPITAEQLQAEMDRMAKHTKQPELLRELFEALANDPFVIAECLARPALAERLLTNWYAYDQTIHGALRQRAEADVHEHPTIEQMKQTSGTYSEIEFVRSDTAQEKTQRTSHPMKLNASEWVKIVDKLTAMCGDGKGPVAAGVPPTKAAPITDTKVGMLSPLQEDETRYYATAIIQKTENRLKVATVSWSKESLESWLNGAGRQIVTALPVLVASYTFPTISDAAECADNSWAATAGPPDARFRHTAVWTGSEMIIWGGADGSNDFNTGYRYNPATDTWVPTSTANAPDPRYLHTALWTGTEMLIWGGSFYDITYLNTGGRYDPSTDTWIATSTTNAPTGRCAHAAVWTGSEMIVWGGYDGGDLSTGGKYDPNTDSWTATSTTSAPAARFYQTAVWSGTEMIVWGGYGLDVAAELNTGGRYNPGTDSWIPTNIDNAPVARDYHSAIWTGSEMIIWGGHNNNIGEFNTGGRYNPNTDTWTATTIVNAPSARNSHTAIWTGNEMIIWGAAADMSGGRYNPGKDSWTSTSITDAPAFRFYHTAVWTGSEMIVWGGGSNGPWNLNTGGRYNPSTDSWVPTNTYNVPTARHSHTAVWTGNEMIVWGGMTFPSFYWNTGGTYNPSTDNWAAISTTNAPVSRQSYTTVWTGTEMIIWGGSSINTGGRYNPNTDTWTATSTVNAPTGRSSHSAVWTGSEMIIWGGDDSSGYANTGGRYNPNTDSWTATSTANAPAGRELHSAVWTGTEMIVWGGDFFDFMGGHAQNTGGRYNPATDNWITTSTTNTPEGRASHTAVWTGTEMVVWGGYFFDGFNPNYLNTGGRYNPITDSWTATSMTDVPTVRSSYTAVWTGDELIIWGGMDCCTSFNTGGRYNPTFDTWRATNTATAPVGRESHTAVWTGTEMIIWGGDNNPGSDLNTGARYCAVFTSPSPTPTATAAATATPTATLTPRPRPTPRSRPTPAPRP